MIMKSEKLKLLDLDGNVVGFLDLNEEEILEFFGDGDDKELDEFMELIKSGDTKVIRIIQEE